MSWSTFMGLLDTGWQVVWFKMEQSVMQLEKDILSHFICYILALGSSLQVHYLYTTVLYRVII